MAEFGALPAGAIICWPLDGIPEVRRGDDLGTLIVSAAAGTLQARDLVVVTSKVVSKAEGERHEARERSAVIAREAARTVTTVHAPHGPVPIVENQLGIVQAAAGVDASNTEPGTVLTLPRDPDRSAAQIRESLRSRLGFDVGVLITDTAGRAWRVGQTDIAIGASGVALLADERGNTDAHGTVLTSTVRCLADEIAGAADLVKGKLDGRPVAVLRGLSWPRSPEQSPPSRELNRPAAQDAFRLGTAEAFQAGWSYANAGLPLPQSPQALRAAAERGGPPETSDGGQP